MTIKNSVKIGVKAWQGNVRELINKIRKAIVLSENHLISSSDLDLECNQDIIKPLKEYLWEYENKICLDFWGKKR